MRLDFGQSLIYNEPVLDIILRGLKNSALIMALSWAIGGALGYVLGLISACNKNSCFAKLTTSISYLLISTPTYWLAIILLFLFCISLNLVSLNSDNAFEQAVLPTLTLTLFSAPTVFFHTKTKSETLLKSDFVKYAKIKGESKRSLIKNHLLKNSSLPAISVQFAQIGEVIGSSVVAESVFSYPGLGFITVKAATSSDVFLLAGISVVTLFIVFVGNIISNLLASSIDPRIKAIKWAR